MESIDHQARPAADAQYARKDLATLLQWWHSAGADTLVADSAQGWFAAAPAAIAAPLPHRETHRSVPDKTRATHVPAAAPRAEAAYAEMASLDAFLTHIRAENPLIPIADGNPQSGIMLIGEGPSAEDLRTGRPFTGPAGRLLDRMLAAIGLDRTSCYISIAAPRRAIPGPVPADAMADDLDLTLAHIRLTEPRLLLLLGGPAAQILTGNSAPISHQRGKWSEVVVEKRGIPALSTYNPAYLLRRPEAKREAWDDLQMLRRRLFS